MLNAAFVLIIRIIFSEGKDQKSQKIDPILKHL